MYARNRASDRAFTLVELIIVLVLIGIIGAVAVPGVTRSDESTLSAAARVLASDLVYVQSLALSQATEYKVTFDTTANEYRVHHVDATGAETLVDHPWQRQSRFDGRFRVRFDEHTPYAGVSIRAASFNGAPSVTFGPLGDPRDPGYVELAVNGAKVWIAVRGITGAVQVTSDHMDLLTGY